MIRDEDKKSSLPLNIINRLTVPIKIFERHDLKILVTIIICAFLPHRQVLILKAAGLFRDLIWDLPDSELTCARKLTDANLIYGTEPKRNREKTQASCTSADSVTPLARICCWAQCCWASGDRRCRSISHARRAHSSKPAAARRAPVDKWDR